MESTTHMCVITPKKLVKLQLEFFDITCKAKSHIVKNQLGLSIYITTSQTIHNQLSRVSR
jgi:hypothetical protein